MSSVDRQLLKQCRELILQKEWEKALGKALVFKGLALLHMNNLADSESMYVKARDIDPSQGLAWQGLEKAYEEQKNWTKLLHLLEEMADNARTRDDIDACAKHLSKLVKVARQHGSRDELIDALILFMPSSRFYQLLYTLPAPDQAAPSSSPYFEAQMLVHGQSLANAFELLKLCEEADTQTINTRYQKQRSSMEAVKMGATAYRQFVFLQTKLRSYVPELYEYILAHPYAQDKTRREIQAQQLRLYETLTRYMPTQGAHADPVRHKEIREKAEQLASDLVLLRVPDELAWRIKLEWSDRTLRELPYDEMLEFLHFFPEHTYVPTIRALLLLVNDKTYIEEYDQTCTTPPKLSNLALNGASKNEDSLFCVRVAAFFNLIEKDYATSQELLLHAQSLARKQAEMLCIDMPHISDELSLGVAIMNTHMGPPGNHEFVQNILAQVLKAQPNNLDALLCRAYAEEAQGEWEASCKDFHAVATARIDVPSSPGRDMSKLNLSADYHLEAKAGYARALVKLGKLQEAQTELELLLAACDNDDNVFGPVFRAKLWHILGHCFWARGGEFRAQPQHAFRCFVESMERSPKYAPAYTSMGMYFEDAVTPPDERRALKSFQHALELDAHEYEAARRLVVHYSKDRAWELVYTVARRVILAESGMDVSKGIAPGMHMTSNPWAWRAAGAVSLMFGKAETAIAAFQVLIRADPYDTDAWISLGEAYVESGRAVAGLKAYARVKSLMGEADTWYVDVLVADAQRRLGRYELAVEQYERILAAAPERTGVRVHLAEVQLLQARHLLSRSYSYRTIQMLHAAIQEAGKCVSEDVHLRAPWKVIGDACFLLSKLQMPGAHPSGHAVHALVVQLGQVAVDARMPSVPVVQADALQERTHVELNPLTYLECAVLVFKYIAFLSSKDDVARRNAWTDLGTALCRLSYMLEGKRANEARAQGIQCAKKAMSIKRSARLWLLLGDLHFAHDPMYAQHAFIMAIESNKSSPVAWTNLGFLYLSVNEGPLAEQAFVRAQSVSPDWAGSWLGSALLHKVHTRRPDLYARLFEQAFTLSDGSLLAADYGLAEAVWEASKRAGAAVSPIRARMPMIALHTYTANRPEDDTALHLCALLAEQIGDAVLMARKMEQAFTIAEDKFSEAESAKSALGLGIVNMNLGRMRLASADTEGATENFELALALVEELGDRRPVPSVRVWCHIGVACAQCLAGDLQGMDALREILASLTTSLVPDEDIPRIYACVAIMLSRFAWAADVPRETIAHDLDAALAVAPHDPLVITTRAALESVHGRVAEYNDVLAKYVNTLAPAAQVSLRNTPQTAKLSMLHLAAAFDMPTLLQYLATTFTRPDNTTTLLVMVAHMHLRLAAGCVKQGKPLPKLPLEGEDDRGSLLHVAEHALRAVEERAQDEGAEHWATMLWIFALAKTLANKEPEVAVEDGEAMRSPADPPRVHAIKAVHVAPWSTDAWDALHTTSIA